jgi:MFS family permease
MSLSVAAAEMRGAVEALASNIRSECLTITQGGAMERVRRAAGTSFGGLPATFWWVWLGTLVNRMGGFVLPYMAFYLTGPLHRSAAFAGVVAAVYGLGASVSSVIGGVLADRLGRRPTILASQLANAATIVALGYARSATAIVVMAALVGLASNAMRPATSALVADIVPPDDRTRAYSLNFWAINLGYSVTMLLMGLVAALGYRALFYGDAATTLACALLLYLRVPETTPAPGPATSHESRDRRRDDGLGAVLRDRGFIAFVVASVVVLAVYGQCNAAEPMAMARYGLSTADFGYIGAINGIMIVLLQLPLTRFCGRYGDGPVLAVSSTLIGVGFAVLLFGHSLGIFALSMAVLTLGEIGYTPTSIAIVARLAPTRLRGRYQGVYAMSWGVASVLAPLLGGATLATFGTGVVWLGCLAFGVAAGAAQLVIARRDERSAVATVESPLAEPVTA